MTVAIPSTVQIIYDGTLDITNHVIPSSARFESLMNAQPGSFELTVIDSARVLSFTTGKTLEVLIDGQTKYGGFVTSVARRFALPVVDTSDLEKVSQRQWVLRGLDWNALFDRRVIRNPVNYLQQLPNFTGDKLDGELIREMLVDSKYIDIEAGYDVTTEVDDIVCPFDPQITGTEDGCDPARIGAWAQQGSTFRQQMEDFVQFSGAVYYIAPDKKLHHKALEDVEARWGFSDVPNHAAITADPGYQDSTIGFREIDVTEDGTGIVNDALIWGGSEFAGEGGTVFARKQNVESQGEHQRWQHAEAHFGEVAYRQQRGVDARANVIVNGDPGAVGGDPNRGLRFPQWSIQLVWNAHDVPRVGVVREHLKAGDLVRIQLNTFEDDSVPLLQILPLRNLTMSFIGIKEPPEPGAYAPEDDEIAFVEFRGTFGLQRSDPYTLWRHLIREARSARPTPISTTDGSAPSPYGALFSGSPVPETDGVERTFQLPDGRGYIAGTTDLYLDGLILRRGIDYEETDPENGTFRLVTAPPGDDWLWIVCRTT